MNFGNTCPPLILSGFHVLKIAFQVFVCDSERLVFETTLDFGIVFLAERMFADFYFRAAGFCSRMLSPDFPLFCGKKCPEKSSRKIPGQNPESSLSLQRFRPSFCLSFPVSPVPCRPWMGNVKITGNRKKILTRRVQTYDPKCLLQRPETSKLSQKGVFAHVGQKPVALVQNRVGCTGARDSWETPFSSWSKHLLRPLLTTLGNLEVSGLCSRHSGSQV